MLHIFFHTRAYAEQVLRGRLTFQLLISFTFFMDTIHLLSYFLDLFRHEGLPVYPLFFKVDSFVTAVAQ